MNNTKQTFVFGFAIFAAFFGAGNLVLPPLLGFNSGPDWWLVGLGFITSATIIPLFALFAHARLQGTMLDFGNKVSPFFSLIFCFCVYLIAVALPCPRTAAVTHEMAIAPFFGTPSILTSSVYFVLVFLFVMNRGKVLDLLGKYLTPLIVIILLAIIVIGIFTTPSEIEPSIYNSAFLSGFFEGYQTYDAIAGLLTGGIVIISLNMQGITSLEEKKSIIARSSFIAMAGLFIIYIGLMFIGAHFNGQFDSSISRPELLSGLALKTLGNFGNISLSILVALACFTTAVAIIVGTADFFKGLFNESRSVYTITAIISCVLGILVGQMDVKYIIDVALPALMFIYPLTIVLIFLNVIPEKFASEKVFRGVVLVTFVFSIPDFLGFLMETNWLNQLKDTIPLAKDNLGWVFPSLVAFIILNLIKNKNPHLNE
ncbi:branched-chain amino acid transport system II carrier protein [Hanstruepera ponticola]|uniref:branched-chain amino acid transport system II carrier protein n=1 Tax=Hanstruepera ponticola TaxID=2042995 RepID=UPI000CF0B8EC|nr:branched-chain amino acid transport system II carrier protein [Hanstruepera ponticola]